MMTAKQLLENTGVWKQIPDSTLAKLAMIEFAEEFAIEFATWYSGMDKKKVQKALKRFNRESQKTLES